VRRRFVAAMEGHVEMAGNNIFGISGGSLHFAFILHILSSKQAPHKLHQK